MDAIKSHYVIICSVLVIVGGVFEYFGSNIAPTFKSISMLDQNNQLITKELLSFPITYYIVRILSGVFYTIAISVFVSVFITDRIEAELNRKREEELQKLHDAVNVNVFDSLFKTIIPSEIFSVIKSSVIETRVVRRNANWIYDFAVADNGNIDLRQTVSFELHNISSEIINEPTRADYLTPADNSKHLETAHCEIEEKTIVRYEKSSPQESVGVTFNTGKDGTTFIDYNVTIPPNKSALFTSVFKGQHGKSVQDEYFTKTALIDGTLTATFPEGYEFKIFSAMSHELRCILDEKTRKIYKLKGAMLPQQGYVYYLDKRMQDGSQE